MPETRNLQHVLDQIRREIQPFFQEQHNLPSDETPLTAATYDADEVVEILESLLTQAVTKGKKVARFEREFAQWLGVRHAIMVNSGSSANLLMMAVAANPLFHPRLQPGDEVLVPTPSRGAPRCGP